MGTSWQQSNTPKLFEAYLLPCLLVPGYDKKQIRRGERPTVKLDSASSREGPDWLLPSNMLLALWKGTALVGNTIDRMGACDVKRSSHNLNWIEVEEYPKIVRFKSTIGRSKVENFEPFEAWTQ